MSGPNFITGQQAASSSAGTSVSVTINGVTAGNTLVAVAVTDDNTVPGASEVTGGGTWARQGTGSSTNTLSGGICEFVCVNATGGNTTITFTHTTSFVGLSVAEYAPATASADTPKYASSGASGTPNPGNITISTASETIVGGGTVPTTTTTWVGGASYNLRGNISSSTNINVALQDQILSASGTFTDAWGMSGANGWAAGAIAILASSTVVAAFAPPVQPPHHRIGPMALRQRFHRVVPSVWVSSGQVYSRVINDTLGLTDAMGKNETKALSDPEGSTDTASRVVGYVRPLNDPEGVTDTASRAASYARAFNDSEGTTDSFGKTENKSLSDTVGITDAVLKAMTKVIADQVGMTDTRALLQSKVIANQVGITDSIARTLGKAISDQVGITDVAARVATYVRILNDQENLTDTAARVVNYVRILNDPEGITDSITYLKGILKTISDSVGITDTAGRTVSYARVIADLEGLTDVAVRIATFQRILNDPEGIVDAALRAAGYQRTVSDQEAISDLVSKVASFVRVIADIEGLSDAAIANLVHGGSAQLAALYYILRRRR